MIRHICVAAALLCLPLNADAQQADDETLVVARGETVEAVINEQVVQFVIAPDAISVPTVNADTAERLDLRPSMLGYIYVIGGTELPFRTDTVRYRMLGDSFRRRTAFGETQVENGGDGVAGPEAFPFDRVILTLRDPQPDDRALVFPLDRMGRSQTGTLIEVGGVPLHVAFSFARGESLVSATAGRILADEYDGYFAGEARELPVHYNVARPVRPLTLHDPLMLGELEVRNLAVRVSDYGSSEGIVDGPPPEGDPDEIVVSANSDDIPRQRLLVGLDTIGHCASITYDFEEDLLTLMCPDQPPLPPVDAAMDDGPMTLNTGGVSD